MPKKLSEKGIEGTPRPKNREIDIITEETGLTSKEIMELMEEKKQELKGLISDEGALFIIAKELGVNVKETKGNIEDAFGSSKTPSLPKKEAKKKQPKNTIIASHPKIIKKEVSEYPIEIVEKSGTQINLATKSEVSAYLDMYNFVKKKIVDPSDFFNYRGKKSMKKSGWRKFIKPFNLSVKLMREDDLGKRNPNVYEDGVCLDGSPDVHAEVYIIVSVTGIHCPNCEFELIGQSIEALGIKSKSEYWSDQYKNFGSYDRHNLIATARTRAENIGISDLVGFGEVSAEEFKGQVDSNMSGSIDDAFGGK